MINDNRNVLVALIPSLKDFSFAINDHWYRIPISTKLIPLCVKNKTLDIIAFYQPKDFKDDAFLVKYYAKVKSINIITRKDLIKDEAYNQKSENEYYKIEFETLTELTTPIQNYRRRRILFIPTTFQRFINAKQINDLYYESPLEEKLWKEFKANKIFAERQYLIDYGKKYFLLDFAIICKNRNLAIECDGDSYHNDSKSVVSDKRRDNILESNGWNVLRYTTEDIVYKMEDSIKQVKETIDRYGGAEDPLDSSKYYYYNKNINNLTLFD